MATADTAHDDLVELYRVAVTEYHFQVRLNYDRAQGLLIFTTGILAAGVGLVPITDTSRYTIAIFAVGAVAAVLSIAAVRTQHAYYRVTRDRMRQLESRILDTIPTSDRRRLPATATTPGMTGQPRTLWARFTRVTTIQVLILVALAVAHVACIWFVATTPAT